MDYLNVHSRKRLALEGQKIGMLTFIKDIGNDKFGHSLWLCRCDCGKEIIRNGAAVKFGRVISCNCLQKRRVRETLKHDLTGQTFGYLTVIKEAYTSTSKRSKWLCKCKCGKEKIVGLSELRTGHTRSCGCLQIEMRTGENNCNWKGGVTGELIKLRASPKYVEWRNLVYLRDKFTCSVCSDNKGHNLHAHHIKRFCDYPELRFDVSNGITLCSTCHASISRKEDEYVDKFQKAIGEC
jgi:hypothetical protein